MAVDVAKRIVDLSMRNGATQCEVIALETRTSSVYLDDCIPKIADRKTETGVGVRFVMGKRIGFTSSTLLSEKPEDVVARARSMAVVSNEDGKFVSLPEAKKVSGRSDRFLDRATAEVEGAVLVEHAMEVVDSAVSEDVTVPNGVLRASRIVAHIVNSLGVDASSSSTNVFGFFTAKSERLGSVGEGVERCWSRRLGSIDFSSIGEELQRKACSVLTAEPFRENWSDIVAVLVPSEASQLLGSLVGSAASSENVNNGSSPWADKIGERVADESLNMFDNGLSELGMLSAVVDDEGLPTKKTALIDRGMLKSYFFDSYNAAISGVDSTGNGMRRNAREAQGRFTVPARCGTTTLEIPPSRVSPEEIVGEVKRGVYIEHFAWPLVDPMSGAFSDEIRNGRLIENGEFTKNIKFALLVGNLYDSLKKPLRIGSDTEVHDQYVMPTIAFTGVEIVGQ